MIVPVMRALVAPSLPVKAGILLALAAGLYGLGRYHQAQHDDDIRARADRERLAATVATLTRRTTLTRRIEMSADDDTARIRTVTRTILQEVPHVVERPVYRDCRLDPDGLRLITAADHGDLPRPSAEPHR